LRFALLSQHRLR